MELNEIISGCQSGNKKCQVILVKKYAPVLLAICKRYTRDHEIANDALQETFINIFKYINGYSGKGSFEGWMKRIAANCSISFQKKYFKHFHESDVLEDSSMHSEVPDVYSKLGKEDIVNLLSELPKSLYVIFNMCVIEGYSHKEISQELGISEGTSRASLSRARARIIEIIEEREKSENNNVRRVRQMQ